MPERNDNEAGRPRSAAEVTDPTRDRAEAARAKGGRDRMQAAYARAEEKNREVRESLEPLAPGERPGPVTAGAILSALIALIFWASVGLAVFSETTVRGQQPEPIQLSMFAAIMTVMAIGMWRARYWAVLGFQMLLVLFLLAAVLGLITAESWLQAIATTVLVAGLGFLFYKMVRAMARIQMPERPGER